jgi:replicative DNA helicase
MDAHAERSVLAAVLVDALLVLMLSTHVAVEDFALGIHKSLWACFLDLSAANTPIDPVTVAAWLHDRRCSPPEHGWTAYLIRVLEMVPYDANVVVHAKRVRDLARLRRFSSECLRLEGASRGSITSVDAFLADADQRLSELLRRPADQDTGGELGVTLEAVFGQIASGEQDSSVSTGFARIDELTTGMRPGEQWVLAARPGVGKTSLALAIALRVAAMGCGVFYASLEMPREQLMLRCLSSEARVDLRRLRTRQLGDDDWPKLTAAAQRLHGLPFWIEDASTQTVFDIESRVRHAAATWARARPGVVPHLVVVDYAQLVASTGNTQNREQEVSAVSRRLKCLAGTLGVTVLLLSQLNREVEKRNGPPKLSDLRESGSLEQDADLVAFLVPGELDAPNVHGKVTMLVAKQRNGERGAVTLGWEGRWTRFEDG